MCYYIDVVKERTYYKGKKEGNEMKKKILERIEELEERNKASREFVRMLDENNEEDKKIIENEQKDRCYRIAIIMEYKMLLEGEV